MYTKLAAALMTALCLSGCAEDNRDAAKQALESKQSIGIKLDYGEVTNYPGGVVCGEYSIVTRLGERDGPAPFIYVAGELYRAPSADDLAIFCSKDSAAQVRTRLGLPVGDKGNSLATIHADLGRIDRALQDYLNDNQTYPATRQGLEALRTASEIAPRPVRFREGGYITEIPVDPWGRPYRYTSEKVLRLEPRVYTLETLGKDGEPGGEGENADVSSRHLKYLDHLSRVKQG